MFANSHTLMGMQDDSAVAWEGLQVQPRPMDCSSPPFTIPYGQCRNCPTVCWKCLKVFGFLVPSTRVGYKEEMLIYPSLAKMTDSKTITLVPHGPKKLSIQKALFPALLANSAWTEQSHGDTKRRNVWHGTKTSKKKKCHADVATAVKQSLALVEDIF